VKNQEFVNGRLLVAVNVSVRRTRARLGGIYGANPS